MKSLVFRLLAWDSWETFLPLPRPSSLFLEKLSFPIPTHAVWSLSAPRAGSLLQMLVSPWAAHKGLWVSFFLCWEVGSPMAVSQTFVGEGHLEHAYPGVLFGPAALASPWSLWEMYTQPSSQTCWSGTLGVVSSILCSNKLSQWFWCELESWDSPCRSGRGPENLRFWQPPRWCWSEDFTLRNTGFENPKRPWGIFTLFPGYSLVASIRGLELRQSDQKKVRRKLLHLKPKHDLH